MKTYAHTETLYTNVHGSIIYNSQNVETTQMSTNDKWANKMWYTHPMEYYLAIKRMYWFILQHETGKHYAKWKKSDTEDHILYNSVYMKSSGQANL